MNELLTVTVETRENKVKVTILDNGDALSEVIKGEMTIEQMTALLQQVVNVLPK